jgi:small subunit ribosomal protein S10e
VRRRPGTAPLGASRPEGADPRTARVIKTDGVLVAKKDFEVKHQELDVKNLFVIKACQSLTSRGFLTTHFSWQYYYVSPPTPTPSSKSRLMSSRPAQYVLTPEGIDYLREYLNIPAEVRSRRLSRVRTDKLGRLTDFRALSAYILSNVQIVPATLKKQVRAARPGQGAPREGGAYRAPRADGADGYRRRAEGGKEGGAGGDFKPRFA